MPEIIETTVYRLDELSEAAKEKARAWYREGAFDHDWFEFVYDDFERICEILGVELKTRAVRLMGGGTRQKPCIWFSGFWSQGDGASFEGRYGHAKGAPARIREHAPKDGERGGRRGDHSQRIHLYRGRPPVRLGAVRPVSDA
nr:hypothetical protein [Mesorhizobium sp.]